MESYMSRDLNKWMGIGRVGQDPETKYLPSGGAVTNLSIACGRDYKDKNTGQNIEQTEWVRVVFFNKLAEIVSEYVKKGSKLYIEGQLRTRNWEKDGVKQYTTEIVASEMQMLDSRGATQNGQGQQQSQQAPQQQYQQQQQGQSQYQQQAPQYQNQGQQQQQAPGGFDDDPPF
jgi:single-strand DNA-binding protein